MPGFAIVLFFKSNETNMRDVPMTSHADTKMIAPNTTGCIELVVSPRRFRQDGAFPASTVMTALGFYHTHAKHWLEHHPIMSMAESRVDEETIRFVFRWEPGDSLEREAHRHVSIAHNNMSLNIVRG